MFTAIIASIGASIGIVGAVAGAISGAIHKKTKKAKLAKLASLKQKEERLNALTVAVKKLAQHSNILYSNEIVALDKYNFDEELFNQLKENKLASTKTVDGAKVSKKISKVGL